MPRRWLPGCTARAEEDLSLSTITLAEIERGIRLQEARDPVFATDLRHWLDQTVLLFSDRLLPFEAEDARIWRRLCADSGHTGAALLIAAIAICCGAVVVTGNSSDFVPTGVAVEDPFQAG